MKKPATLPTLTSQFQHDAAYWGDNGAWLVCYTQHRDSDALGISNWRSFLSLLGGESDTVQIERAGHWAVGWVEYLIIAPDAADKLESATEALEALERYPVLDEDDFSTEEMEQANETWKNCYSERERIDYMRTHSSQFDFRDFADMRSQVRGEYFAGYASELLH